MTKVMMAERVVSWVRSRLAVSAMMESITIDIATVIPVGTE